MGLRIRPGVLPHVLLRRGNAAKPRLRLANGRFAPFGGKRNRLVKGKALKTYNTKSNKLGTGVEQIKARVRKATGQTSRPLAYGHIMNGATASTKAKRSQTAAFGAKRRGLQSKREVRAQLEALDTSRWNAVSASSNQPKYKVEFNANFGGKASEPVNGAFGRAMRIYDKGLELTLAASTVATIGSYAAYKVRQEQRKKRKEK